MQVVPGSQQEKVTIMISPVRRAQDLFALARYLNTRFHWPHFQIASLENGCAVFKATQDGWQQLRRTLEDNRETTLCLASIKGNQVNLRMLSACLDEGAEVDRPSSGEVENG